VTQAVQGGLTRRTIMASALLAVVVGAAFAVLVVAIADLRDAADRARHSEEVLAAANQLERLVIDLETGQRGFVITGEERFLDPWNHALRAVPEQARTLERMAAARHAGQGNRPRDIARDATSYIQDYSIPTVEAARRDPASVRTIAVTDEGKRRIDRLRTDFDEFAAVERDLAATTQEAARAAARRAIVAAAAGVVGSIILVMLFTAYLTRGIVRPVRQAAAMAARLAGGDLAVRMPETGPGEIGGLERAFNTMAGSLESSRQELHQILEEQAALRRVATLVAKGVSPTKVFAAVAEEVGRLLGAPSTRLLRYEADRTACVVAAWSETGIDIPVGSRLPLEGDNVAGSVLRTGHVARMDSFEDAPGPLAAQLRKLGIRSAVGAPIVVEDRLWGAMIADWMQPEPLPGGTEGRLAEFTGLVATAIANAESRAELTASRARVVAAADNTRRRLERDLHDGTQQRLVSLSLDLRTAEASVPNELADLRAQLAQVAKGLSGAVDDLREISRGLHPAVLSRGGLGPALKTLSRRSAVPVRLELRSDRRLPDAVEVAAYYVVSEALTNAAKHARASAVHVELDVDDTSLRLDIRDDGVGGADPVRGSGLVGLKDRVEALGGTIEIISPTGAGTSLAVKLPAESPVLSPDV
jgi:signal transduction histidine kinase